MMDVWKAYYDAYFDESMRKEGGRSADSFQKVVEQEPGLLEKYLRTMGIRCRSAEISGCEENRVDVTVEMMEGDGPRHLELYF